MASRQPPAVEEVEARAARLGVTAERVLQEYARIAFSSIERIATWDEKGELHLRRIDEVSEDDLAAVAEIVASASSRTIYRIKLHDKKPVLDAIGRYLALFSHDDETGEYEDPRQVIIREFDRLEAEAVAGSGGQGPADANGG